MNIDLKRYFNPDHGLELEPDINTGVRQNENGIVFFTTLYMLTIAQKRTTFTSQLMKDMNLVKGPLLAGLQEKPGLYNRGISDKQIDPEIRRTISHDNITAISTLVTAVNDIGQKEAKEIADYGLEHGFVYQNAKGFRLPMNPGDYSPWLFNGGYKKLSLLFFPFFFINFVIAMLKNKQETSSRQLYFQQLFSARFESPVWAIMWKLFAFSMERTYGIYAMERLTEIYYKHPEHPCRIMAQGLDIRRM